MANVEPFRGHENYVEYKDLQNIVQIRSGYNFVYWDRSYVAPVIGKTSFSAEKTNLVLVGTNAFENTGRSQVNLLTLK